MKQLDRFHLQLQLDLGKSDAPYKEVIVEFAIARLLEEADENLSGATGGITPKATEAEIKGVSKVLSTLSRGLVDSRKPLVNSLSHFL